LKLSQRGVGQDGSISFRGVVPSTYSGALFGLAGALLGAANEAPVGRFCWLPGDSCLPEWLQGGARSAGTSLSGSNEALDQESAQAGWNLILEGTRVRHPAGELSPLRRGHRKPEPGHRRLDPGHRRLKADHRRLKADHRRLKADHRRLSPGHRSLAPGHRSLSPDRRRLAPGHRRLEADRRSLEAERLGFSHAPRFEALLSGEPGTA
jgi:hypothetical protein